jgi:glycosyltransferase involved in cell wall biosynthesis
VQPRVTIVTPSYNQGEFIRATIESVLAQDYPELEYIVMDGGSTDQTAAIVAEYGSRLTWISEKDRGQAHAINKGFAMASGEIVAWVNSDDLLLPGAVQRAVRGFGSAPRGVGGIYGEGYLMDRQGRFKRRFPHTEPFNLWKLMYLSDYILQQSTFFRRTAIAEIGWLDENLHYAMDWDLLIRLGKRFGLHYIPEYLGALREYPEAKTFAGGSRRIEEIRMVLERHTGLKRAPGYWTYGAEMRRGQWQQAWSGRRLQWFQLPGALVSFCLYGVAAVGILLVVRHAQGLYRDRWVSSRLRWVLPEGEADAIIRGHVPDQPDLAGQTLKVRAGGRDLGRWPVGPGDFALRFTPPAHPGSPFQFEVLASRYQRPKLDTKIGFRRMAWILKSIERTEPE